MAKKETHHMKGTHIENYIGNIKNYGFKLSHMDLSGGWIHKTKKGHIAGGVMKFKSKHGKDLYVRYNRNGRVTEITSDEDEENEDDDDEPGKDTNKFGKRTLNSAFKKIKNTLTKLKDNPRKFKEALKNSLTMKDTKFNGITKMLKESDPVKLWQKALNTWENMKGREMTDIGKGKLMDYIKKVTKTVDNKKGYKGLFVKLDEDTDFIDSDDLLALLLI